MAREGAGPEAEPGIEVTAEAEEGAVGPEAEESAQRAKDSGGKKGRAKAKGATKGAKSAGRKPIVREEVLPEDYVLEDEDGFVVSGVDDEEEWDPELEISPEAEERRAKGKKAQAAAAEEAAEEGEEDEPPVIGEEEGAEEEEKPGAEPEEQEGEEVGQWGLPKRVIGQEIELEAGGEKEKVTVEEAIRRAQKIHGAHRAIHEARQEKERLEGERVQTKALVEKTIGLIQGIGDQPRQGLFDLFCALGCTPEQAIARMDQFAQEHTQWRLDYEALPPEQKRLAHVGFELKHQERRLQELKEQEKAARQRQSEEEKLALQERMRSDLFEAARAAGIVATETRDGRTVPTQAAKHIAILYDEARDAGQPISMREAVARYVEWRDQERKEALRQAGVSAVPEEVRAQIAAEEAKKRLSKVQSHRQPPTKAAGQRRQRAEKTKVFSTFEEAARAAGIKIP